MTGTDNIREQVITYSENRDGGWRLPAPDLAPTGGARGHAHAATELPMLPPIDACGLQAPPPAPTTTLLP
jgi:hypothetical protein